MKESVKKIKSKLKTGDLAIVKSGKWRGLEDYIFSVNLKKKVVYLQKASILVYDKSFKKTNSKNHDKKENLKKKILVPIKSCKVNKVVLNSEKK